MKSQTHIAKQKATIAKLKAEKALLRNEIKDNGLDAVPSQKNAVASQVREAPAEADKKATGVTPEDAAKAKGDGAAKAEDAPTLVKSAGTEHVITVKSAPPTPAVEEPSCKKEEPSCKKEKEECSCKKEETDCSCKKEESSCCKKEESSCKKEEPECRKEARCESKCEKKQECGCKEELSDGMELLRDYFSGPDGLKRSSSFIRFANMLASTSADNSGSQSSLMMMTSAVSNMKQEKQHLEEAAD